MGFIKNDKGDTVARVTDVQKAPNGQALHTVDVLGSLSVGTTYHLEIDHERRNRVMKIIRLLIFFMRRCTMSVAITPLQAGSLNEVEFLRFDFYPF